MNSERALYQHPILYNLDKITKLSEFNRKNKKKETQRKENSKGMRFFPLFLLNVIGVFGSNPISAAVNTIKSGVKLTSKAMRTKPFQRVKKGGENIRDALKMKKDAEGIWEQIENFLNPGMNSNL